MRRFSEEHYHASKGIVFGSGQLGRSSGYAIQWVSLICTGDMRHQITFPPPLVERDRESVRASSQGKEQLLCR